MARRTLLATLGFDLRHVLPALRLMPYDRLVIVAGRDTFRSSGFRWLKDLEPSLRTVAVAPFDLAACIAAIRHAILENAREGPVRISVGGGTKILTSAAILAAFQEGIESWYCDPNPIRLPVLRGVRLMESFTPSERTLVRFLRGPMRLDRLVEIVGRRGISRRTALASAQSLASKGLVELEVRTGHAFVRPSTRFALFRAHLRETSGKG